MKILNSTSLETPLGSMLAVGDEDALYLLDFVDSKGLEREMKQLKKKTQATIVPGRTPPIDSIEKELKLYFAGTLKAFKTPLCLLGSPFQNRVWEELRKIPLGSTCSYAQLALAIGKPSSFRAVAKANATNQLVLIIPCHRVINKDGKLGGYSSGLPRKKWLIDHEKTR